MSINVNCNCANTGWAPGARHFCSSHGMFYLLLFYYLKGFRINENVNFIDTIFSSNLMPTIVRYVSRNVSSVQSIVEVHIFDICRLSTKMHDFYKVLMNSKQPDGFHTHHYNLCTAGSQENAHWWAHTEINP